MASRLLILSVSTVFLVAGCAWGPRVATTPPVAFPAAAATYRLVGVERATAADVAVASALRRQLQANGWRESGDAPVWRVETAYAVRPQKTGSYSDDSARDEAWIAEPSVPQWWAGKRRVHSLTVILTGPGESPTTYQASAAVSARERDAEATIERLAEAVAAELKPAS